MLAGLAWSNALLDTLEPCSSWGCMVGSISLRLNSAFLLRAMRRKQAAQTHNKELICPACCSLPLTIHPAASQPAWQVLPLWSRGPLAIPVPHQPQPHQAGAPGSAPCCGSACSVRQSSAADVLKPRMRCAASVVLDCPALAIDISWTSYRKRLRSCRSCSLKGLFTFVAPKAPIRLE